MPDIMESDVTYEFEGEPATGEVRLVAPGVYWLRMPLPFKLDHINLWLLEDDDGWTIVDTGINTDEVKKAWLQIFADHFAAKPLKRVIVTHFHPDHMGLAGWLTERFDVSLWAPMCEWAFARLLSLETGSDMIERMKDFYRRAGFGADMQSMISERANPYPERVSPIPSSFVRIMDGEDIRINGRDWKVIVGAGHSPEHACLYCHDLGVLISGDQVLPKITPNIGVWPQEPDADPLRLYLKSLLRYRELPEDTLVLPSHKWPFRGLTTRLDTLAHHHDLRLEETLAACAQPVTGYDVLKILFKRELDRHQLFFAIGEALAHLHYLVGDGRVIRTGNPDGADLFSVSK